MELNNKQRKTLEVVFDRPTRANIAWADVEKLLKALEAEVIPKGGSVMDIRLKGRRLMVHRPHPQKEAYKGIVDRVREFLMELGIKP